jgi:hypothetical protein
LIWLSWIRIQIQEQENLPNLLINLISSLSKRRTSYVKIQLFVTAMSDQDTDPHLFGSLSRIRIEVKSWIRIRITTNTDPKHYR